VDPSYPAAIQSEDNQTLIRMLATEYSVIEARGPKRRLLVVREEVARNMVADGADMSRLEWEV
jgi:hypothetical protein